MEAIQILAKKLGWKIENVGGFYSLEAIDPFTSDRYFECATIKDVAYRLAWMIERNEVKIQINLTKVYGA